MTRRVLSARLTLLGVAALLAVSLGRTSPRQTGNHGIHINSDEIGGVVASSKGPEAGVWVVAETTDLPTRYIKEVVTDDRGRYLIPDLPKAKYLSLIHI